MSTGTPGFGQLNDLQTPGFGNPVSSLQVGPVGPTGPPGPAVPGPTGATGPTGPGATSPGGSNTDIQYNNSGAFGGDANLTWIPNTTGLVTGAGLNIGGANGFAINGVDAGLLPAGYMSALNVSVYNDTLLTGPFSTVAAASIQQNFRCGQNQYGFDSGGHSTLGKTTAIALEVSSNWVGAGQHICSTTSADCYGMSDAFLFTWRLGYATGPVAGDEGQGYCPASMVMQQDHLAWDSVASVTRTTFSTTTTADVLASTAPQVIPVASTTGANVGDWIVFNQAHATPSPDICAAQITAVGAGTITCICPNNFSSGITITPALVLHLNLGGYQFGQDRVLVNLSGASYSAGLASSNNNVTPGLLTGDGSGGQNWTAGMVGGNAANVGAVSFYADTYRDSALSGRSITSTTSNTIGTGAKTFTITASAGFLPNGSSVLVQRTSVPYTNMMVGTVTSYIGTSLVLNITSSAGTGTFTDWTICQIDKYTSYSAPMRSWYQIADVTNGTNLTILSLSVAGDQRYYGNAPQYPETAGGLYIIKPAARILHVIPNTGVVCETSTATWTVGDEVECVICPYPDVHGFDFRMGSWTPGGTRRSFMQMINNGARAMEFGLSIVAGFGATIGSPGSDLYGFDIGLNVGSYKSAGLQLSTSTSSICAIAILDATSNDAGTSITWPDGFWRNDTTNVGLTANLGIGNGGLALLSGISHSTSINPNTTLAELNWQGWLRLSGLSSVADAFIEFGVDGGQSGQRVQILSRITSGAGLGDMGQLGGLDFHSLTGSPSTPTTIPIFSLGGAGPTGFPFAGWPAQGASSSPATNRESADILLGTSVWTGSVSALRPAILRATPGLIGNQAPVTFSVLFADAGASYNLAVPTRNLSTDENGILFFGKDSPFVSSIGVNMDASATTAIRNVVWPNLAGGNLVIQPTSTGVPGTSQASGTAGEVRWDTTHIYFCFATGTGASDRWFRASGASSW